MWYESLTYILSSVAADHTWVETSRIEATEDTPGSVEYTCSTCHAVQKKALPAHGVAGSLSEVLSSMSAAMSAALGWVGTVSEEIVRNPLLFIPVAIGFFGVGVSLFRRLLRN